jgi:catechol 2,3-dioxygenase-like lactoylglutathione lyase family enzyme
LRTRLAALRLCYAGKWGNVLDNLLRTEDRMSSARVALESIGQVSIIVKDVDRAKAFYRDTLGMNFLFEFPGMAFFDCGGVRLYLARADKPGLGTSILYYRVADIQASASALGARGVAFLQRPAKVHEDARHELWLGFFNDSEENTVALMSEVPK